MLRNLGTIVLMLLLATPLAATAQNTGKISGRVVDDLGDPLPGANVIVEGTQLGAATDIDGNYFIIGVPVGEYDVTASFVGYQTQTVEGLQISSGYTTEQNFELGPQELGQVTVTYERPIIQKDAIGAPRVVTGEDIQNLPVRGVGNVAALQGGVVADQSGTGDLFIRGGRDEEVAFYVDGVKIDVNSAVAVNTQAIQEQEMLIGTIPARYGDVQSGVISITTKSGGTDFFGTLELITSEVLDGFGYNVGSLSIGGPIIPNRANFFLSAEGQLIGDDSPYGVDTYQLTDDAYNNLLASPQRLRALDAEGNEVFIPFPAEQVAQALADGEVVDQGVLDEFVGEDFDIQSYSPIAAPETLTENDFELERGKDDPRDQFTLNGNVTFNVTPEISLRAGGAYDISERHSDFFFGDMFQNSLYNRDAFYNDDRESWRVYGTFRQRFGTNTFYQLQAEYQDWQRVRYPNGFSDDIAVDGLEYGNTTDGSYYATARRYFQLGEVDTDGDGEADAEGYVRPFGQADGTSAIPLLANNFTFALPGAPLSQTAIRYEKLRNEQLRFSGSLTTQLGLHQLEVGGEFEQQTRREYEVAPYALARYAADGSPEIGEGVENWSDLPFAAFPRTRVTYYGYNYLGTEEVDDQDPAAFFNALNTQDASGVATSAYNLAPHKPIYYAGYISDKIEFRDLVVNLGARVDVFDNNTDVLRDAYAALPIARVSDAGTTVRGVEIPNFTAPAGIGSDYAVYFGDSGNSDTVVGYRDLDGNFYFADGTRARQAADITGTESDELSGSVRTTGELNAETYDEVFGDYDPQVTFMPRVGVSFPVTDRALFFASYNVTSQRPTERNFWPFYEFVQVNQQDGGLRNAALEPEKTIQYELGFRQRIGERAAVTVSGFLRNQENKITNRPAFGGTAAYGTYFNEDFTTTKGVEVGFDLRRTQNVALNANYTLSFAEGTGSDATATSTAVWRGEEFPNTLFPSDFDQRHTLNVSVDYRLGDNEGPQIGGAYLLENFGVNILGVYGSGTRYTALQRPNEFTVNDSFTSDVAGELNGGLLPSTSRIDLRIDRSFELGFAGTQLKAYLWVQNLLDTENVVAVYRATGAAGTDGFLQTAAGVAYVNQFINPESAAFNYNAYAGGPVVVGPNQTSTGTYFYGAPRQVRLGLLLNF
jgi:hypothetical protein